MSCPGMTAHEWVFTVVEGHAGLATDPCGPDCWFEYGIGDCGEFLEMPPVAVTVAMATDCPAYDTDDDGIPTGPPHKMGGYETGSHYTVHGTRCDCNWWPVARPVSPVLSPESEKQ